MSSGYLPSTKSTHYDFNRALGLWRDANERSWILVAPSALGETFLTCALTRAFRLQHPGPLTLVVKESHAPIAQLYSDDITRIIPMQGDLPGLCRTISPHSLFAMDVPYIVDPVFLGDGRLMHLVHLIAKQPGRGGLRGVDLFRYVMHLDWDSPLTPGTIPAAWRQEAEAVANELGLVRGRSVILFPDNNTNWPVADELWQTLADHLRAQGLTVVTNLHGNDVRNFHGDRRKAFAGTTGYSVPLHLAAPLVEYAGGFVAGSNGIAQFIVGNVRCRAAVLLHDLLPGQRMWSGEEVVSPRGQSMQLHTFDYSGIAPLDVREYVIKQGEANADVLTQIALYMGA